jgi:hypothetical protein
LAVAALLLNHEMRPKSKNKKGGKKLLRHSENPLNRAKKNLRLKRR